MTRKNCCSPDDTAAHAARVVVRSELRAFKHQVAPARHGDVEGVHELRVATRQLRASLRFFAPVLPARFVSGARRDVGWLADTIGAVRDLDVMRELVKARARHLNRDARKGLGPLIEHVRVQRAMALEALIAALRSARGKRVVTQLAAFAKSAPPARSRQKLGAALPALLRPLLRAVKSAVRTARHDSRPETLHRVRVRVKRLRYALEGVRGLGGKEMHKMLRMLKGAQELLGDYHDAGAITTRLQDYAKTPGVPASTLVAVGALSEDLARRSLKLRDRVPDVLLDLGSNMTR